MTMESIAPASPPHREPPAAHATPPTPIPVIPRVEFDYDVAIVGLGYVGLADRPGPARERSPRARHRRQPGAARRDLRGRRRPGRVRPRPPRRGAADDEQFTVTNDADPLSEAAAIVICVPTPIDEHLTPDLDILRAACATVVEHAVAGQLLLLTSTTYVGCTRDLLVAPLADCGLRAGHDIYVAFSPERIDPGNDRFTHEDVPRVVGGATAGLHSTRPWLCIGRSAPTPCIRSPRSRPPR